MNSMIGQIGLPESHSVANLRASGGPAVNWKTAESEDRRMSSDFAAILLAIAAHDLRQPLQTMQYVHNSLSRALRTKSELNLLELSQTAINRMSQQLRELLGALLVHEKNGTFELKAVGVGPLLQQAFLENRDIASQKGISIRVVGTSESVLSDPLLLGVILRNLVNNAINYTNPGGRILVGCRHFGPNVRIDVLDSGIGITKAAIPKLFNALTRLDPDRGDGLGIGLFIVRKVVDLLGHRIDVSSAPYRGSRFSIVVPRVS